METVNIRTTLRRLTRPEGLEFESKETKRESLLASRRLSPKSSDLLAPYFSQ
jgi:hypothetical protein